MKIYRAKVNPAFKKTQPLPVLPANFAGQAGRAAAAISRLMQLQGALSPVGICVGGHGATLRPGFNASTLSLVG